VKSERCLVIGGARLPKDRAFHQGNRQILNKEWVRPVGAPSRGPAFGHGSDFASRWSILDCRAEGYVGQVGAFIDPTDQVSCLDRFFLVKRAAFREPRPTSFPEAHA
jgi:hypothetical protein